MAPKTTSTVYNEAPAESQATPVVPATDAKVEQEEITPEKAEVEKLTASEKTTTVEPALVERRKPSLKRALPEEDQLPVQKNRRRCWECRAKVALAAVTCRCGYTFCNRHRYAEEHKCSFNFKSAGKRQLADENPPVVPAKVARIN